METLTDLLECGHSYTPIGFTTGYGVNRDDESRICYTCCFQLELACMAHGQRITGYLASEGSTITTWPGEVLARVYREHTSWHNIGGHLTRVWALDDMGQWWHGTTPGRGQYARLRLSKPETLKHAKRYPEHAETWQTRKALRTK